MGHVDQTATSIGDVASECVVIDRVDEDRATGSCSAIGDVVGEGIAIEVDQGECTACVDDDCGGSDGAWKGYGSDLQRACVCDGGYTTIIIAGIAQNESSNAVLRNGNTSGGDGTGQCDRLIRTLLKNCARTSSSADGVRKDTSQDVHQLK